MAAGAPTVMFTFNTRRRETKGKKKKEKGMPLPF